MRSLSLLAIALILAGCTPRPLERAWTPAPSRTEAPLVGALVDQPVGGDTRAAVLRESADLQQCMAQLTAARVTFRPMPDRSNTATCGLSAGGCWGRTSGPWRAWPPATSR